MSKNRDALIRLCIRIKPKLHEPLRAIAFRRRESINAIIVALVDALVEEEMARRDGWYFCYEGKAYGPYGTEEESNEARRAMEDADHAQHP